MIAGVSTRAFAESAHRAGFRCVTIDAFGDLDQKALIENLGLRSDLGRRYTAAAAAAVSRRFDAGAAAYVGNFENHPAAVRRLAAGRCLLGNTPETLAAARDPSQLANVVERAGGRVPLTLRPEELGNAVASVEWLRKPIHGGGGSGVRPWRAGTLIGRGELVQERIDGVLASAVFAADGRSARLLGLSHLLAGAPEFGARRYRYAGSISPLEMGEAESRVVQERVTAIVAAATAAFGLRGVNGLDFIFAHGDVYVLELNPRYPASAELIERATGRSVFAAHVAACDGSLPDPVPHGSGSWGKAIVYARRDCRVGDTHQWLEKQWLRDVPQPHQHVRRGAPVCTVLARADDATACRQRLVELAAAVHDEIERGA